MPDSNRAFLKAATQSNHNAAEDRFVGPAGFSELASYTDWLNALHRTHTGLGAPAAYMLGGAQLAAQEHARICCLEQDLGAAPTRTECAHKTNPSPCWAWGVHYVLNGSALGASILLKTGGVQDGWPCAYLHHMQRFATTGALKGFFNSLDGVTLDRTEALRGARDTFANMT